MRDALRPVLRIVPTVALGIVIIGGWSSSTARDQKVPLDARRAAHMQDHFAQAMAMHRAVIRGDLAALKSPATWLADHAVPPSMPPGTESYPAAMSRIARRAAGATDIPDAAASVATLLTICGECHQAAGTMPAVPLQPPTESGSIAGHMLRHQRAVDQMLQGLVVPSHTLWRQGARDLSEAPLRAGDFPVNRRLGQPMARAEQHVHALASQAVDTNDSSGRASIYGQLLATCAGCHEQHTKAWGPEPR